MNTQVTVALVTTVVPLIGGGIGWMVQHMLRVTKVLHEVKDQVANSHGTNLRDDLDFVRDLVLDVRADIAWVRRDHIDLVHKVALLEGPQ